MQQRKIIACDFDGTLFTNDYPDIGEPIWKTINYCKEQKENGAIGNTLLLIVLVSGLVLIYHNKKM